MKFHLLRPTAYLWLPVGLLFTTCRQQDNHVETVNRNASRLNTSLQAQTCQPLKLRWAKRFQATCQEGQLLLTVLEPWRNRGEQKVYRLVSSGAETKTNTKGNLGDTVTVLIPLHSVATLVSVQSAYLTALGLDSNVKAVARKSWLYSPSIRQRIDANKVKEVGDGQSLDLERLATLHLDAVFHSGSQTPDLDASGRLAGAGLNPIMTGEWMENHPLGRAEWIRFFGALWNKQAQADSLFAEIEKHYLAQIQSKPIAKPQLSVLSGLVWQGVWYVPGGRSYPATLARDAGLRYFWATDSSEGSLPLSIEAVMAKASQADVWLNPGEAMSMLKLASEESRLIQFKAFRQHLVFSPTARAWPDGGNDFWETAVVRPDQILCDLIRISNNKFDSLTYYRRLPN